MFIVFQKIDPQPLSLPGKYVPPAFGAGEGHSLGGKGGGGQYFGRRET
jgi:hypothetical protein